tara:strand:- start:797 stop:1063 length:267 start_codon:yes stop_codon:yes gene_type:complete
MAHSLQAKKRIRQTARRASVNRARRTNIRSKLRKVEEAIVAGDQEAAKHEFRKMQPSLMAGINKGIVEKNTVSRTLSRLHRRIKNIAG